MSLPRLFARAEGPTRGRFAEVLQAFESGESLARAQELDLRELRALPPYALEGYGRALSQERPHVLRDLWPRLSAAEATLVAIGAGWAAEERSRRIDVPAPYDGAAADGGGFARALFHAYALGHPQRFEHDLQEDFDRGVGRGIYFAFGAVPPSVCQSVERFPHRRRDAIWSGVGVALSFTGGVDACAARALVSSGAQALARGVERGAALRQALHGHELPSQTRLALGALEADRREA